MTSCCSPGGSDLQVHLQRPDRVSPPLFEVLSHDLKQSMLKDICVPVPGGDFMMGDHSGRGYSADGETPVHRVTLNGFSISTITVTNAQFKQFVKATGYETTAERLGVSAVFYAAFKGARSDILHTVQGLPWWLAVQGADWKHPHGPASTIHGKEDHPVVHVSWFDAVAYCDWAGARLPTEAEWEYAARGGLKGAEYTWGDDLLPGGRWSCNIWQGKFPTENIAADGFLTTAPVKTYRPNGYGLWQMSGNVWEWCQDWFNNEYYSRSERANPTGPESGHRRVMRGGSYLCHDSYCNRYRVTARNANTPDATAGNIGFRVVADMGPPAAPRDTPSG